MHKLFTGLLSFLLLIGFYDACGQPSQIQIPGEPIHLYHNNIATSAQYENTRAFMDSLINPVLNLMLAQNRIDSATLESCDKIITIDKEVYVAHIHNITYSEVRFIYPSEDALNALARSRVSQILYNDGRIDVFVPLEDRTVKQNHLVDTSRIIIRNQKDWMKVKATENPSDISDLVSKGSIKASFEAERGNVDNDYLIRNATNQLKKKAARLKAHYILIESKFFRKAFGDLPSVEIIATAYAYE